MFDNLAKMYEDSDYTTVIIIHWSKHIHCMYM